MPPGRLWQRPQQHTDLFLYDLKLMDDDRHRKYTGVSNRLILSNLQRLSAGGAQVIVRIPLIPGVNDDEQNLTAYAAIPGRAAAPSRGRSAAIS